MGSEESYEDPYSGKGSKKNSLHQKSVLEGGLDSDIPHIKQDRIDKTVPTFQETAENGKSFRYNLLLTSVDIFCSTLGSIALVN